MKRALIKWWISGAIDGAPQRGGPSKWLRAQIDGDRELLEFERAAGQLESRLRSEAAEWIFSRDCRQDIGDIQRAAPCHHYPMMHRWLWSVGALAAMVLVAFAISWWGGGTVPPRNGESVDPRALQELFTATKAVFQPLVDAAPMPQHYFALQFPSNDWDKLTRQPIARIYGSVKNTLERDRRHMTEDLQSAVTFFAEVPKNFVEQMSPFGQR